MEAPRFPSPSDQALAARLLAARKLTPAQLEALRREQARRGGPQAAPLASLLGESPGGTLYLPPGARQETGFDPDQSETPIVLPDSARLTPQAVSQASTLDRVAPPQPAPGPPLPRQLGRYVCREVLGRGGMGIVYLARDPELGRDVALKTIFLPAEESPEGSERRRKRFVQEARATARLRHPHIVTLHEVGEHEGTPYVVMDYVQGESLEALLQREGRLPARRAAEIVREVALALQHAHEQGIVHRDVKPQNVLLDARGQVRLTDFGLARDVRREETQLTMSGQLLGTPHYLSPEQARAQHKETDARSDVFALGGVLYRTITGELPFVGENLVEIVRRVLEYEPIAPRERDPAIHADLETIALRCLEKEPARRYQSAAEVARELERFLASEAILARPPGRRERLFRWARRNPALSLTLSAASLVVLGLLATGAYGAWWSVQQIGAERDQAQAERGRAEEERRRAREAEEAARAAAVVAESRSREKDIMIARALRERGERLLAEQRVAEAAAFLARSLEVNESPATRETLAEALPRLPRNVWSSSRGAARALAASLDGGLLVAGDSDGRLVIARLEQGRVAQRREVERAHRGWVLAAAVRPDGGEVASGGEDGEVRRWSASGQPLETLRAHAGPVTGLAWGANGHLVSAGVDGQVKLWSGARPQPLLPSPGVPLLALASGAGGQLVAAATEDGRVLLWSLPDGAPAGELRGHEGPVTAVALDPDGARAASGGADRTVRAWDVTTARPLGMHRLPAAVSAVAFLPGREEVAAATLGGEVYLRPAAESAAPVLLHPAPLLALLAPGRGGDRLLAAGLDGEVREGLLGGDPAGQVRLTLRGALRRVVWRPDGQRLLAAGDDALLVLDTTPTSARRAAAPAPPQALGFGPGGEPLLLAAGAAAAGLTPLPPLADGERWLATTAARGGGFLALALGAQELTLWRPGAAAPLARLPLGDPPPEQGALSSDGVAALACADGRLLVWRPGQPPRELPAPVRADPVLRLGFSPAGRHLLVRLRTSLRVIDPESAAELATLPLDPARPADPLACTPDARLVAVGWTRERRVEVWDAATGVCLQRLPWDEPPLDLAFSPEGRRLAVAGGRVRVIELPQAAPEEVADPEPPEAEPGSLLPLAEGGWYASAPAGGVLRLAPGQPPATAWAGAPVRHLLLASPDARRLLVRGADLERGEVRLLEAGGKELRRFDLGPAWVGALGPAALRAVWSPDGRRLLLTRVDEAAPAPPDGPEVSLLLDLEQGTTLQLRTAAGPPAPGAGVDPPAELPQPAVQPDGARVALVEQRAPRRVRLIGVPEGRELGARLHAERITALALDAQGRLATASGRAGQVRLWEPGAADPLLLHERLGARVLALGFDPAGRWLASLEDEPGPVEGQRLRLRLFDLARRAERASLPVALPLPRRACELSLRAEERRVLIASRGRARPVEVEALGLATGAPELVQRVWAETGLCVVGLDPVHAPSPIERLLLAGEW